MKNHIQHVAEHLVKYRAITPWIALNHYRCFRLASVIKRLKERGWAIKTEMQYTSRGNYALYKLTYYPRDRQDGSLEKVNCSTV